MIPIQNTQLMPSEKAHQSIFQKQITSLNIKCKTIKTLLVEGIFKKESKFTAKEIEEAEQAWMRG